jgi:tRNA nucleotidyltransferase (CCA-adding enzyme)
VAAGARDGVVGDAEPARADGIAVIERLRELPAGCVLLELACGRADVELIGGAVRDLLLDRRPRELDVVVDGAADAFAGRIAAIVDCRFAAEDGSRCGVERHERFGTASVAWTRGRIDIAARRSETYTAPGALPDVRAGTPAEDLQRRDFTINTLSVGLGGKRRGRLDGVAGAREDLAAGVLRVLHDESFRDDPTRLMRMARYRARLHFTIEPHTAQLAADAIAGGALDTVSPARIGAELRLVLAEPDPVAALASLAQLGVLTALHQSLTLDASIARAALDALPASDLASADVLLLAVLLLPPRAYDTSDYETRLRGLLDRYEFPAAERERAVHSAILAPRIAQRLQQAQQPSEIYAVAHGEPLEAIALAAALADADGSAATADAARRWLDGLRLVSLEIDGNDLLDAGIASGPELGRRLRAVLMRRLDGELQAGREAELRAALERA